jgi:hypothetical protein
VRLWIQLRNFSVFRHTRLGYRARVATGVGGLLVDLMARSYCDIRGNWLFVRGSHAPLFRSGGRGTNRIFWFPGSSHSRLVRKNYRTFRIYAIRRDGQRGRKLALLDVLQLWLCIMGTQLAFLTVTSLVFLLIRNKLPAETIRSLSSLSLASFFGCWTLFRRTSVTNQVLRISIASDRAKVRLSADQTFRRPDLQ